MTRRHVERRCITYRPIGAEVNRWLCPFVGLQLRANGHRLYRLLLRNFGDVAIFPRKLRVTYNVRRLGLIGVGQLMAYKWLEFSLHTNFFYHAFER